MARVRTVGEALDAALDDHDVDFAEVWKTGVTPRALWALLAQCRANLERIESVLEQVARSER